jgi:OmpA-OmpF porin, OOP family
MMVVLRFVGGSVWQVSQHFKSRVPPPSRYCLQFISGASVMLTRQAIVAIFGAVAGVTAAMAAANAQANACAEIVTRINRAASSSNVAAASGAYKDAEKSGACSGDALRQIGRTVSLLHYTAAAVPTLAADAKLQLLENGLKFGRPWEALAFLADQRRSEGQRLARANGPQSKAAYGRAAALYQDALNDINDAVANPQAPPKDVIRSIHQKAQEMSMLAPVYVKPPTDRSGKPGGLAAVTYRGFAPVTTVLAVEFVYNQTVFTPKGREAANDMLENLKAEGFPAIRLIGHTDPVGGDGFNDKLSLDRAEALKAALVEAGYTGAITVEGKGKRELAQVDDPGQYNQQDLHQISRRVEMRR